MDPGVLLDAVQLGFGVYGPVAMATYLSFRILRFPDLTVEGSFPLGGAVAAVMVSSGWNALPATAAGVFAGCVAGTTTAWLHVRWGMMPILAGILTMHALYAVNLRILGGPNLPLGRGMSRFAFLEVGIWGNLIVAGMVIAAKLALDWFLDTELGLATRSTGSNPEMSRNQGIQTGRMVVAGLALANGFAALGGALAACVVWRTADANMGAGVVILGLAAVFCGEIILPTRRVFLATLGCLLGSVVYQSTVAVALQSQFLFLRAQDLRLVTSGFIVALMLLTRSTSSLRTRREIHD